jgi:hypothetical protein
VDCTSYYELEQQEYARKGVNLTPDLWMMKLMVGAVDRSYDEQVGWKGASLDVLCSLAALHRCAAGSSCWEQLYNSCKHGSWRAMLCRIEASPCQQEDLLNQESRVI